MNNGLEKYLPIGTVCLLKDAKKRVMIIGFCGTSDETKGEVYDYVGCIYPEGFVSTDINLLFNHDKIEKIYFLGYFCEEEYKFKGNLNKFLKEQELEKKFNSSESENPTVEVISE